MTVQRWAISPNFAILKNENHQTWVILKNQNHYRTVILKIKIITNYEFLKSKSSDFEFFSKITF